MLMCLTLAWLTLTTLVGGLLATQRPTLPASIIAANGRRGLGTGECRSCKVMGRAGVLWADLAARRCRAMLPAQPAKCAEMASGLRYPIAESMWPWALLSALFGTGNRPPSRRDGIAGANHRGRGLLLRDDA
jgi:hypothetical protein